MHPDISADARAAAAAEEKARALAAKRLEVAVALAAGSMCHGGLPHEADDYGRARLIEKAFANADAFIAASGWAP